MKFDICVGNPPYQGVNHQQIYPHFYLWAKKNCDQMSMIFPSGWQEPKNKNGLQYMNTEDVKYDKQIVSIDNIVDVFKGVSGAKNTNIVYWKKDYDNGLDGKQLVYTDGKEPREEKFMISKDEIKKPKEITQLIECLGDFIGMDTVTSSRKPYLLDTDFLSNPSKHKMPNMLMNHPKNKDDIRIFGLINNVRTTKYVDKDYPLPKFSKDCHKDFWKIFIPKSWGNLKGSYIGGAYGDILIVKPNDICTDSFIELGYCKNFEESKKYAKYCMSNFFRTLLMNNKFSIMVSKNVFKSIPIQDYTEDFWNSDNIDDIDEGLFDKYNVPEEIRQFVRDNIQPRTIDDILGYEGSVIMW